MCEDVDSISRLKSLKTIVVATIAKVVVVNEVRVKNGGNQLSRAGTLLQENRIMLKRVEANPLMFRINTQT